MYELLRKNPRKEIKIREFYEKLNTSKYIVSKWAKRLPSMYPGVRLIAPPVGRLDIGYRLVYEPS